MARASIRVPFYNDDYLNKRLETHQTIFEVLRGKIAAVISDSEIEEYRNGNITMASKLSSAIQTVDGFSQEVSELQTAYDAATGEFNTLVSKVSQFEQTVDGFTQTVSRVENQELSNSEALETLSGQVSGLSQNMSNYVLRTSLKSEIEQTAGSIDLSVFKNTALYTKTEVDNQLNLYTPTTGLVNYIKQNKSNIGISDDQIVLAVTGSQAWGENATQVSNLQAIANAANTLASQAKSLAEVKNNIYYGSDTPTGTSANPLTTGDLWVNSVYTTDSATGKRYYKSVLKRYNGSSWVEVQDTMAADALALAGNARAIADGKIKTYQQTSAPTNSSSDPLDVGDLWLDTDDGNRLYRWNGSSWADVRDTGIKAANDLAQEAKTLAGKKTMTYYQSSAPTSTTANPLVAGDLWYNSSTKKAKRWGGSAWVDVTDPDIAQALSDAADAQATADGKIKTYYQTSAPTGLATKDVGDLWIDTDDNNNLWRWNGSKWVDVHDKNIDAINKLASDAMSLAEGKIKTWYQSSTPSNPNTGDMWIDTTKKDGVPQNILKRYNGSSWEVVDNASIAQLLTDTATIAAVADKKIMTYTGTTAPVGTTADPLDVGDLWIDTSKDSDGVVQNLLKRWNGTSWIALQDGQIGKIADIVATKISTYHGTDLPTGTIPKKGDLWIDTTKDSNNKAANTLKRYNGSKWEVMDNPYILEAYNNAATARAVADRKIETYLQADEPVGTTAEPLDEGDLWIDTNDGNRMYIYTLQNGWVDVQDEMIQRLADDLDDVIDLVNDKITTYYDTAEPTKTKYPNLSAGDIWFTTKKVYPYEGSQVSVTKKILKRYNGTQWVEFTDELLEAALAAADTAQSTADKKVQIFTQASEPANNAQNNLDNGDLWVNTDDDNKMYIWSKINNVWKWERVDKLIDELITWKNRAEIELTEDSIRQTITSWGGTGGTQLVNMINQTPSGTYIYSDKIQLKANSAIDLLISGKTTTFYQDSFPTRSLDSTTGKYTVNVGDICYRTDQNNRAYVYTGSGSGQGWKEADNDKVLKSNVITSINADSSGVQIKGSKIKLEASDDITLAVNNAKTYAENQATAAKNAAISDTNTKLESYTKTAELKIGINGIQTKVIGANIDLNGTKDAAVSEANTATDTKLANYTTTANLVSYINQQSGSINLGVIKNSSTLATKTYADQAEADAISTSTTNLNNALKSYTKTADLTISIDGIATKVTSASIDLAGTKNAAVNAANSDTDTKLTKYTKTTELMSYINQQAGSIEIAVVNNLSSSLSQVQSTANTASSTANTAKSTAETAKSTADTAKTTANTANSTANTAKNTADTAKATADTAKSTANTAKSTADTAKNTADTAKTTADTAKSTAETKNTIFRQGSTNPPTGIKTGDMWYDTSNYSKCYVWTGSSWEAEKLITRINLSEETATINADKIQLTANSAINLMVTGKNSVWTQPERPSTRTYNDKTKMYDINKGDIWYDTDDNYKMYVCTSVSGNNAYWTAAITDKVSKDGVISAIANTSETAQISANKIALTSGSELANKLKDGQSKAKVFYTASKPTQSTTNGIQNINAGDFWVNTGNDYKDMYVWSGSSWVPEKLVARINASADNTKIAATKVDITAATLGIDASLVNVRAKDIRLQASTIKWTSDNSSMTETGILTCKGATINGTLTTQSGSSITKIDGGFAKFFYDSTYVSHMGTLYMNGYPNYKGTWWTVEPGGSFLGWATRTSSSSNPTLKLWYAQDALNANTPGNCLYAGCNLDMNGYSISCGHINTSGNITARGYAISTYNPEGTDTGYIRGHHKSNDGTTGITGSFWAPEGSGYRRQIFKDGLWVGIGEFTS